MGNSGVLSALGLHEEKLIIISVIKRDIKLVFIGKVLSLITKIRKNSDNKFRMK